MVLVLKNAQQSAGQILKEDWGLSQKYVQSLLYIELTGLHSLIRLVQLLTSFTSSPTDPFGFE